MSKPLPAAIHYTIVPLRPEAHLFRLTCELSAPDPGGQVFRLPAWIPGSYMIREFSRNIVSLRAEAIAPDGSVRPVSVDKLDKHTWRVARIAAERRLRLVYDVYAWDLSVRAAHLDQTHGFFNGTSVFLAVEGRTAEPCTVDILPPEGPHYADWRVATTLPGDIKGKSAAKPLGFGRYRAADYDELIDHPVEMGRFTHATFEACGVRHEIALTGRHDCDLERLTSDLARICTWHIRLFGEPAPVSRYLFMAMIVGDGYGGLEHRASTALLANRNDLPYHGMDGLSDGYKAFLGLCSHEYFHTWNVKRIKPAAFVPYRLGEENYTRLLWVFEGFTSYYDDLALVRCGVIGVEDYLALLAKTLTNVLRGSGRLKQSVAESSFDAWTKYYRQDENAPNAIVSYYAKGALIALALDLQLRAGSGGRSSLDDVMRALWQQHGQTGIGLEEDAIFELVAGIADAGAPGTGRKLADWLERTVRGTDDLPLARLLKPFGVELRLEAPSRTPTLGVKLAGGNGAAEGGLKIANVFDDGPAQRAGLSAGDVVIAIDGLRASTAGLDAWLARRRAGEKVDIHVFRRDELLRFEVQLDPAPAQSAKLALKPGAPAQAVKLRKQWLQG
ncbi:MAG: M61 family metallopeptidase [Rhodocyclaceae bacterium]